MSLTRSLVPANGSTPARHYQWPFIGVVVLLVVLILMTPSLFSSGAGSLPTRAQLIVDRPDPGGNTSFYVDSIGTSTRYQVIAVGLARLPDWPFIGSASAVSRWNWTNSTQTLILMVSAATNPVAVNVSVKYTDPSGVSAKYIGVYGFDFNTTTLTLNAENLLPGGTAPPASTPMADLPIYLLLPIQTSSGPSQ
jgi:hypothetical protein